VHLEVHALDGGDRAIGHLEPCDLEDHAHASAPR
jgi:hypothetical protein